MKPKRIKPYDLRLGERQEFKSLPCGCVLDRDPLGDPQFTFCETHRRAGKTVATQEKKPELLVKVTVSGGVLSVDDLPPGVAIQVTEKDNGEIFDVVYDPKKKRPVEVIVSRFEPKR